MADDRIDPSEQIPEADLLEQLAPLDSSLNEGGSETVCGATARPVDEADLLEQFAALPVDDADAYPNTREPRLGEDV